MGVLSSGVGVGSLPADRMEFALRTNQISRTKLLEARHFLEVETMGLATELASDEAVGRQFILHDATFNLFSLAIWKADDMSAAGKAETEHFGDSNMTGRLKRLIFAAALLLYPVGLPAQTVGSLEGTVTDTSGPPMPNAIVVIHNEATGVEVRLTTNEAGYYRSPDRPSGTYTIEVDQAGFKRERVSGINIDVNSQVRRDLTLAIGDISESVQVQASAVQVNTTSGTVATTITTEQIQTAVLNGRHYSRLAMLVPGAVYNSGSDELAGAGLSQTSSPFSINGLNNKSAGWFVDGAYDMNVGNGEANTHVPPIDSIGEVQIQTANYSARYGTTGGAVITSVTKSGASAFHGSAYEYLRNNVMDARNFFAQNNPPLRQNQYGFSIGGPVLLPRYNRNRNKTFFFWNEEWRKRRNALTSLTITPTDALRSGR